MDIAKQTDFLRKSGSQEEKCCKLEEPIMEESYGILEETAVNSFEAGENIAETTEYGETSEKVEDLFTDEW